MGWLIDTSTTGSAFAFSPPSIYNYTFAFYTFRFTSAYSPIRPLAHSFLLHVECYTACKSPDQTWVLAESDADADTDAGLLLLLLRLLNCCREKEK